jgi:preflagellin peptidase FlaK
MLGIASYTDVKKREVSDFLWVGFGIIAVALIFLEPNFEDLLLSIGISLIVAPFVLLIWRFGLFGGADAFAVIVLAVLAPQITLTNNVVTPFTVLTNTVLLSIIPMFVNLIRNLMQLGMKNNIFEGFVESKSRRILAMFVGYKAKNPKYSFSIERKAGKKKKLNLSLQHAEYAQFCNTPNTWVTPGVPYMLFIAGGFIIQLIYGDIIFNILGLRP